MSDPVALEALLTEDRRFAPPEGFASCAFVADPAIYDEAEDFEAFWARWAEKLHWFRRWDRVLDWTPPHAKWFVGGRLNVCYNCVDRHLDGARKDKTALIWEGETGERRELTYRELGAEVGRFANVLKDLGVRKGDRVAIYMPMIPETVYAMLACARIGAVHSVVFGGFSPDSLADRINDARAGVLITADGGYRRGSVVPLKRNADEAVQRCSSIRHVVVVARGGLESNRDFTMVQGRDQWYHDVASGVSDRCPPEEMDAEDLLYILYTSGTTGKPKGVVHTTGGYLTQVHATTRTVFDLREDDVYWCTADVGWVTGHSYIVYGPLSAGATVVIYEGAPDWPDKGRFWKICEDLGVTIFYTAPTAIRAFMQWGDRWPGAYDLGRLRLLGTVGEPINPEAWMWYHRVIGNGGCPIVDTWWQTETGGIMISPVPGVTSTKPGSCTQPLPGVQAAIVDENGEEITEPDRGGYLVIRHPWPSMLRNIWGDSERYRETYFGKFGDDCYITGDSARRDADGYFWIMGRLDDVVNVSGHRLGTMEVESALVAHPSVAEAAVVSRPHEIKGESIFAFVVLKGAAPTGDDDSARQKELRAWVDEQLGPIARPDDLRIVEALPKTRSGKIMRRLLRSIARGEEINQDISTLENADLVRQLMQS